MSESTVRTVASAGEPEKKGWLFKWTNYLKGYQRRWFVLSNGLLSYYRNQAEMAHTCRGTISLMGALIHTADSCTFVISNGGTQTFHIRAHDEVERQSWVTALELAKAKAIRATESDDEEDNLACNTCGTGAPRSGNEIDDGGITRDLSSRFHDLRTCSELVLRHGTSLQRSLADLEIPPCDTTKQVSERATLFRISCNAMINACTEFMSVASLSTGKLSRVLQHEREQKMRLQEVVEQLARQHDNLEKTVSARNTQPANSGVAAGHHETDDEEHEFFDAQDQSTGSSPRSEDNTFIIKVPVKKTTKNNAESSDSEVENLTEETQQVLFVEESTLPEGNMGGAEAGGPVTMQGGPMTMPGGPMRMASEATDGAQLSPSNKQARKIWPHVTAVASTVDGGRPRRSRVPDKPNYPLHLWSIMKNCIGKELSKIPIPVNFSEPLSMLQRLTEDFEYSAILDLASACTDPAQQLAYVAAFTVSSYATTACRTNKPFNPLLGETYECDRMSDLGWRSVSEQVSHHPPMLAQFCEGATGWRCWQEFTMTSKFRGKYLQIIPLGDAQAHFPDSGNKYSWRKVSTTVHNIIVGKLWVDNHGDMEIVGEEGPAAGYTAQLKYLAYSYFSNLPQRKVTGIIKDPLGKPRYALQGYWDDRVEIAPVTSSSTDNSECKTGKFTVVWERVPAPPDSDKWYNFTLLAAQLNEPEPGVAPTDSRNRPDQRLMEEGLWDEANVEKVRLEDKQRTKRREIEAAAEGAAAKGLPPPPEYQPVWFHRETVQRETVHRESVHRESVHRESDTSNSTVQNQPVLRHVYNGDYWTCKEKQDWSRCPDIF